MTFHIEIRPPTEREPTGIAVRIGDRALTRLLRPGASEPSDYLYAPPELLAQWIAENWWRLRWEPMPSEGATEPWLLAHGLRSISNDYAWPDALLWGQDSRVVVSAKPDPVGVVGPVRFLCEIEELPLAASDFEHGTDSFLKQMAHAPAPADSPLCRAIGTLFEERSDPDISAWRRLEARLGFDPDTVPESLMEQLGELAKAFAEADIEEAASAAPGPRAADILQQGIAFAQGADGLACDFAAARTLVALPLVARQGIARDDAIPWKSAEALASDLRARMGVVGPLADTGLRDLLEISSDPFESASACNLAYAIRVRTPSGDRVGLRSKWRVGRRFELARTVGDLYYTAGDDASPGRLGPIARSKTARQQFQRAFGASLLCPYSELQALLHTDIPERDDVAAAARHFDVSEQLVLSTLVNHQSLSRDQFQKLTAAV
ncbi:MAG TPA: hypothetical protein VMV31_05325 [Terriglobales bacterium]|nr:hypothetical protein [Terriglobales bacterium]